jgi:hypothetical protein
LQHLGVLPPPPPQNPESVVKEDVGVGSYSAQVFASLNKYLVDEFEKSVLQQREATSNATTVGIEKSEDGRWTPNGILLEGALFKLVTCIHSSCSIMLSKTKNQYLSKISNKPSILLHLAFQY